MKENNVITLSMSWIGSSLATISSAELGNAFLIILSILSILLSIICSILTIIYKVKIAFKDGKIDEEEMNEIIEEVQNLKDKIHKE